MNEPQLARNIKDILDASLGLSPEVVARLKVARERALERHRAPVGEWVLAGAGRSNVRMGGPGYLVTRVLLPAAFLVAAAIGLQHWQDAQRAARSRGPSVGRVQLDRERDAGVRQVDQLGGLRRLAHAM